MRSFRHAAHLQSIGSASEGRESANVEDEPGEADGIVASLFGKDGIYAAILVIQLLSSVLVTPLITRLLGAEQFGDVALGISASQIVWTVADLGLAVGVQREYVLNGVRAARRRLAASMALAMVVSAVAGLTMSWWGDALGLSKFEVALRLGLAVGGVLALLGSGYAFLRCEQAVRSFGTVAIVQVVGGQLLGLGAVFVLAHSAARYFEGLLCGYLAAFVLLLACCRPALKGLKELRPMAALLAISLPLVPQQLADFVMNAGDRVLVGRELGAGAVGRYQVAYNVGSITLFFLIVLNKAWMPRVLEISQASLRWKVLNVVRGRLYSLLVPCTVGLALSAPLVLGLWAPRSYHSGGLVVLTVIVSLTAFPFARSYSAVQCLISEGSTGAIAISTAVAAGVNVGLNVILIPLIGLTGSALATLLSFMVLSEINVTITRARSAYTAVPKVLRLEVVLTCAAAVVIAALLPSEGHWLIGRLVAAGCVGMFLLWRVRSSMRSGESQAGTVVG